MIQSQEQSLLFFQDKFKKKEAEGGGGGGGGKDEEELVHSLREELENDLGMYVCMWLFFLDDSPFFVGTEMISQCVVSRSGVQEVSILFFIEKPFIF